MLSCIAACGYEPYLLQIPLPSKPLLHLVCQAVLIVMFAL